MKKIIAATILGLLSAFVFGQTLGEKALKKVTVNSEKDSKRLRAIAITEYDSMGNKIHHKDIDGYEEWHEYDNNGNEIHYKDSFGKEQWNEYDSNENKTHYKDNKGREYWNEYNSNGKLIHSKDSNGREHW